MHLKPTASKVLEQYQVDWAELSEALKYRDVLENARDESRLTWLNNQRPVH